MAWNITDRFPLWGEVGEFPPNGFFYQGGDKVNEKHLDALWNGANNLQEDVQTALTDIDSNADGVVDAAETSTLLKNNDIDSDGDGVVDAADNATKTYKGVDLDVSYATQSNGGRVGVGNAGLLYSDGLESGKTFSVFKASLTKEVTAAPTGTSLLIVTLDGSGGGVQRSTIINGDGSTFKTGLTGEPLASYENTSGSDQTVAVVLDNGEFGTGSGSAENLFGSITAREK